MTMADLTRWEPMREAMTLRDAVNRLFEESFVRPFGGWSQTMGNGGAFALAVDMYETGDDVTVKASLPGVKPEDVDITVTGNVLEIRGETKQESDETKGDYHYRERRYGSFQRSLTLPVDIQPDQVEATFEDGVLTLKMPKAEQAKARQIKIQPKHITDQS
jgi:HSP20 family protein